MLGLHVLRMPLVRACGALGELPFVAKEHVKVAVVPCDGVGLPSTFDTAGGGVHTFAAFKLIDPAQALLLNRRAFWLRAYQALKACAMRFAKGVATCNQCHGFFIVHGHACKSFAHIAA